MGEELLGREWSRREGRLGKFREVDGFLHNADSNAHQWLVRGKGEADAGTNILEHVAVDEGLDVESLEHRRDICLQARRRDLCRKGLSCVSRRIGHAGAREKAHGRARQASRPVSTWSPA